MPADRRAWKLGNENHRRTFLQSSGTYRFSGDGDDQEGVIAFWGEWEGAAELVTELDPVVPDVATDVATGVPVVVVPLVLATALTH